jgi:hypothetical protein
LTEVREFSEEIIKIASERTRGREIRSPIPQLFSIFVFFASAFYTLNLLGNLLYHFFGFFLAFGAIVFHFQFLDRRVEVLARDERFSKYGLLSVMRRDYPFLLRQKGPLNFIAYVKPAAKTVFSGVLPPYGFSIIALLPFDYLETMRTIQVIYSFFEIAEQVELLINEGGSKEEIRIRLSKI